MAAETKILIIDDDPFISALMETYILKNGHSCILSDNGVDSLEKIDEYNPDLVLLDVVMPKMDGFEVCRRIKNNPLTCDIPVIILTAAADKKSRIRGISEGANDFLAKPVDEIELEIKIKNLLKIKKNEDLLKKSLHEKEVLLKEIHHRVKNNMNVIVSLLNLQCRGITDTAFRAMCRESQDRIKSMALIHEKLYGSQDLAHIDFKEYLNNLVCGIGKTYNRQNVHLDIDMEPIFLDVNVGIPCGLIVNELVTNSLKYAFPEGREGTIRVGIRTNSEGNSVLFFEDDGVGFPAEVDFLNTSSLGLKLVTMLTMQINGTIKLSREGGTRFSITFPGKTRNKIMDKQGVLAG